MNDESRSPESRRLERILRRLELVRGSGMRLDLKRAAARIEEVTGEGFPVDRLKRLLAGRQRMTVEDVSVLARGLDVDVREFFFERLTDAPEHGHAATSARPKKARNTLQDILKMR